MQHSLGLIFSGILLGSLGQAQESTIPHLYTYTYGDQTAYISFDIPARDDSGADARLLAQVKEYKLKDKQGRDITLSVSPYYYRPPSEQAKITFQGLEIDSTFTWSGELSFAPAEDVKEEFSLQEKSGRIKFKGIELLYEHLPAPNEIGANFKLSFLRHEDAVKDLYILNGKTAVELKPLEKSKGLADRNFYFNIKDKKDLTLGLVIEAAQSKASSSMQVTIVAERPSPQSPSKASPMTAFQPLYFISSEGMTMIALQPKLEQTSTTYLIKRDEKQLTLNDAKNTALQARFGIFREPLKEELHLLGFEEALDTPYLSAYSQIIITSKEQETTLEMKGDIPLPPRLIMTVKE